MKSSSRRNDYDYPVAVHFNDSKHDISTLRFCSIEHVPPPLRKGDHDKLFKTERVILDLYPQNSATTWTK